MTETRKVVKDKYNNKEKDENKNRYDTNKTLGGYTFSAVQDSSIGDLVTE